MHGSTKKGVEGIARQADFYVIRSKPSCLDINLIVLDTKVSAKL
jgi:hypothetical protein